MQKSETDELRQAYIQKCRFADTERKKYDALVNEDSATSPRGMVTLGLKSFTNDEFNNFISKAQKNLKQEVVSCKWITKHPTQQHSFKT